MPRAQLSNPAAIMNAIADRLAISYQIDELKAEIKRINSDTGHKKVTWRNLAEGSPSDCQELIAVANHTYRLFRQIDELKQQLKQLEDSK